MKIFVGLPSYFNQNYLIRFAISKITLFSYHAIQKPEIVRSCIWHSKDAVG